MNKKKQSSYIPSHLSVSYCFVFFVLCSLGNILSERIEVENKQKLE